MRWVSDVHHPKPVTVTSIVYIPSREGYWEDSLQILDACLGSLRDPQGPAFDLFVFDNGSCEDVRAHLLHLQERGVIQYLMLSRHNLGKVGAWNHLFGAAAGDTVAYTDSDMLFAPGWLAESLEVLSTFEHAGMVTAQPLRRDLRYCATTLRGVEADQSVTTRRGHLLPQRYIEQAAYGLGRSLDEYSREIAEREDILIERDGVQAYVSADHCQFICRREALDDVLSQVSSRRLSVTGPLSPHDDQTLDHLFDQKGYWRLSLPRFRVRHLGNRLRGEFEDVKEGFMKSGSVRRGRAPWTDRLRKSPRIRKSLKRAVGSILRFLYPE